MKLELKPGKYILAVSGGVDSMVLLHLLVQEQRNTKHETRNTKSYVVAHFDHGIRPDSAKDAEFVQTAANSLGLAFELGHGKLGPHASEAQARDARYAFLNAAKAKYHAKAIITAHHQDDLLETAVINLLRGSGRAGLTSMLNDSQVLRPLLGVSKQNLVEYARAQELKWREDPTNSDQKYLRNYVRLKLLPKLKAPQKLALLKNIEKVAKNKPELDLLIAKLSQTILKDNKINRGKFLEVPNPLDKELVAYWLGKESVEFDRRTVERVQLALKTARPASKTEVSGNLRLVVEATEAHFSNR